jgi:CBS domain-containing protein
VKSRDRKEVAMSRRDVHLDVMLRHLGAAYYDTLHGRAAPADVARALDQVAERVGEQPKDGTPPTARPADGERHRAPQRHGRWHTRVGNVMTTSVVTVDRLTPYKEIARLLVEHRISGVPVLGLGRQVLGVVSEGDLLAARNKHPGRRGGWAAWLRPGARDDQAHAGLTAGEMMTAPPVTIHPGASVAAAARLMNAHNVRRLPVVDNNGRLAGLVSRRDLISVFLRPDAEIAQQASLLLAEILPTDPAAVKVTVRNGVVELSGRAAPAEEDDLIPIAERLVWDIDGVVDVVSKIRPAAQRTA